MRRLSALAHFNLTLSVSALFAGRNPLPISVSLTLRRSLEPCVVGTVAENLKRNRICNTLSLSDEVVPLLKLIASFLASSEIVANDDDDDDDDDIVVIFLLVKCGQSLAAIKAQTTTVCVGVCVSPGSRKHLTVMQTQLLSFSPSLFNPKLLLLIIRPGLEGGGGQSSRRGIGST